MTDFPVEEQSLGTQSANGLDLVQAFRKALSLYGQVYDFPVIVQYESGRLDAIPSAQLKDIAYIGEAYEVLFAMQDTGFLKSPTQDTTAEMNDAEIIQIIGELGIIEAL